METIQTTFGALAEWVGRRIVWLRATLDIGLASRHGSERGQGLAEYALILSLIAIVVIGALGVFGVNLKGVFLDPISEDIGNVLSGL
jgi:pilus assembly protein Flp/PilA